MTRDKLIECLLAPEWTVEASALAGNPGGVTRGELWQILGLHKRRKPIIHRALTNFRRIGLDQISSWGRYRLVHPQQFVAWARSIGVAQSIGDEILAAATEYYLHHAGRVVPVWTVNEDSRR